jgi:hypothetical protein
MRGRGGVAGRCAPPLSAGPGADTTASGAGIRPYAVVVFPLVPSNEEGSDG